MYKPQSKTKEPENINKAYEYAVFLLSLKLRTVGEVLKKMEGRGYGQEVIEQVIDQLKAQKYLDDNKYAEVFLENLKAYKNFGYYGIKKKFMEKKIPMDLIESTLENGLTVQDEIKIAKRFLSKLSPSFGGPTKLYAKLDEGGVSLSSEALAKEEGGYEKEDNEDDNQYTTFNEESTKEKQKLANRLKSRGFRGEVISRLVF